MGEYYVPARGRVSKNHQSRVSKNLTLQSRMGAEHPECWEWPLGSCGLAPRKSLRVMGKSGLD